jgi:Ran GTPase-activating protein (RanGAP) involved in mRNA processing and transport
MLTHNIYEGQMMDNEEPIVWHEPILYRYWEVLEAEIDRMRQLDRVADISDIQITNVEIKKERLDALVDILLSGSATISSNYVIFGNANLCADCIISVSKLVDVSLQLIWLSLHHNRIDNMESACCISRSLKLHSSIMNLRLNHCIIGSNPEILSVILHSDVNGIYLENNNIDSLGAVKIVEYLQGDPPMHHIDLCRNRLNDDDAILISQALKRNTNLHEMYLLSNNITFIGVKAIHTQLCL